MNVETCKHEQATLVYAKGRCSNCGKEIWRSDMKKILVADRKAQFQAGFKAGYAKAVEDSKKPAAPIPVPENPAALEEAGA